MTQTVIHVMMYAYRLYLQPDSPLILLALHSSDCRSSTILGCCTTTGTAGLRCPRQARPWLG